MHFHLRRVPVLLMSLFFKFRNVDLCNKKTKLSGVWWHRLNHKKALKKFLRDPRYISGHLAMGSGSVWGEGGGERGAGFFRYYLSLAATYVGSYFLKDEVLKDSCCLRRMQDEEEQRKAHVWPRECRLREQSVDARTVLHCNQARYCAKNRRSR